jgi:hypothetical protein
MQQLNSHSNENIKINNQCTSVKKFKKSVGKNSAKSSKKSKIISESGDNENDKLHKELQEDFMQIKDEYDVIQYLGKGSYGIVAKVYLSY